MPPAARATASVDVLLLELYVVVALVAWMPRNNSVSLTCSPSIVPVKFSGCSRIRTPLAPANVTIPESGPAMSSAEAFSIATDAVAASPPARSSVPPLAWIAPAPEIEGAMVPKPKTVAPAEMAREPPVTIPPPTSSKPACNATPEAFNVPVRSVVPPVCAKRLPFATVNSPRVPMFKTPAFCATPSTLTTPWAATAPVLPVMLKMPLFRSSPSTVSRSDAVMLALPTETPPSPKLPTAVLVRSPPIVTSLPPPPP